MRPACVPSCSHCSADISKTHSWVHVLFPDYLKSVCVGFHAWVREREGHPGKAAWDWSPFPKVSPGSLKSHLGSWMFKLQLSFVCFFSFCNYCSMYFPLISFHHYGAFVFFSICVWKNLASATVEAPGTNPCSSQSCWQSRKNKVAHFQAANLQDLFPKYLILYKIWLK